MGKLPILLAVCAMIGFGAASADPQDLPNPESYIRPEDQERARLMTAPCTEADVGHGCDRDGGLITRRIPCTFPEDGAWASLPTDQCNKMEEPRRYRGIWTNEFEGSAFVLEGTTPPKWPRPYRNTPEWRAQADRAIAASIWLDVGPAEFGGRYPRGARKLLIEFVGRKTMYTGHYGHFGMFGNEIIVDRVISLKRLE